VPVQQSEEEELNQLAAALEAAQRSITAATLIEDELNKKIDTSDYQEIRSKPDNLAIAQAVLALNRAKSKLLSGAGGHDIGLVREAASLAQQSEHTYREVAERLDDRRAASHAALVDEIRALVPSAERTLAPCSSIPSGEGSPLELYCKDLKQLVEQLPTATSQDKTLLSMRLYRDTVQSSIGDLTRALEHWQSEQRPPQTIVPTQVARAPTPARHRTPTPSLSSRRTATPVPQAAVVDVRALLTPAVTALLAARYEEADAELAGVQVSDPHQRAAVHLLRSAVQYRLYERSGATDTALLEQARENAAACAQLDRDLTPDERWFSPKFRRFFADSR